MNAHGRSAPGRGSFNTSSTETVIPIRDVRAAWASAGERAGLPRMLFIDLQSPAVRNLAGRVPEQAAMKLVGLKDPVDLDPSKHL
jgi:hypothetical protein